MRYSVKINEQFRSITTFSFFCKPLKKPSRPRKKKPLKKKQPFPGLAPGLFAFGGQRLSVRPEEPPNPVLIRNIPF
jgi:hypothetical protein